MGISAGGVISNGCNIVRSFSIVTRSSTRLPASVLCPSVPTISVSSFDGKSLILVTGSQQAYSISCTYDTGEICTSSTVYQITVTGGPTPSLISLTPSGTNPITFSPSTNLIDAGVYTISVQIQTSSTPTIVLSAAANGTFTYVNPCLTATFSSNLCYSSPITVAVGSTESVSTPTWVDSVTNSISSLSLICAYTLQPLSFTTIPTASMSGKITYASASATLLSGT